MQSLEGHRFLIRDDHLVKDICRCFPPCRTLMHDYRLRESLSTAMLLTYSKDAAKVGDLVSRV